MHKILFMRVWKLGVKEYGGELIKKNAMSLSTLGTILSENNSYHRQINSATLISIVLI